MAKKNTKRKPWNKLNAAELAAATKQFEKPLRFEDTKPLSPALKEKWDRSRADSIFSVRVYNGKKKTIEIQVDESLLRKFDEFAERNDMTRDEFIARSLRSAIAFAD